MYTAVTMWVVCPSHCGSLYFFGGFYGSNKDYTVTCE